MSGEVEAFHNFAQAEEEVCVRIGVCIDVCVCKNERPPM